MVKKIILNAGGTGGHFFPAIATGEELINRGYEVHLLTDKRCEKYITPDIKLISHIIDLRLKSGSYLEKFKAVFKLLSSTLQALVLLYRTRPSIMISFGGYPTIPGTLAAVILRIPIILHEQNCFLGKTNKFFTRFAKIIALSYQETNLNRDRGKDIVITGDLVRSSVRNLKAKDNFDSSIFRIFIFGGSQAASIFSSLIPESIKEVLKSSPEVKLQIVQQAPLPDHKLISEIYSDLNVEFRLSEFFQDIASEYKNAQLVICRAGASTIAELTQVGLPAIFIPYPYAADDHQYYNAKAIEERGGGWCIKQSEVIPGNLAEKILELINNREILKAASSNLLQRRSDGANILADTVAKIIL